MAAQALQPVRQRLAFGGEAGFGGADQAIAVQLDQRGEVRATLVEHRADMPLQVFAQRDQVLVEGPVNIGRQCQTIARVVSPDSLNGTMCAASTIDSSEGMLLGALLHDIVELSFAQSTQKFYATLEVELLHDCPKALALEQLFLVVFQRFMELFYYCGKDDNTL